MEQLTKTKFIQEIREMTGNAVAKKQDEAVLNYPKIQDKIKNAASLGESEVRVSTTQMNEYDKALLEKEGFDVDLVSAEKNPYNALDYKSQFGSRYDKEWRIRW